MTERLIRLAVADTELPPFAHRVRGAIIQTSAPDEDAALASCDAIALLEPGRHDEELIERCLASGKHVLLTVPSLLSGAALDRLWARARRSGVHLALFNPDRYIPSRRLIRQQVETGRLGEPGLVRIHRWYGSGRREEDADPLAPVLGELDLAIWLIGRAPNLIYALQTTLGEERTGAGWSLQLHLGFPDGPMALIDCVGFVEPSAGYRSLSLIGSAGAAYADDHQNIQLVYRGGHLLGSPVGEGDRAMLALVQEFVSGLHRGLDLSSSVPAWRRVLAVADAARQSAASRQAVPLEAN